MDPIDIKQKEIQKESTGCARVISEEKLVCSGHHGTALLALKL
jgi:hypothetical protein